MQKTTNERTNGMGREAAYFYFIFIFFAGTLHSFFFGLADMTYTSALGNIHGTGRPKWDANDNTYVPPPL